ncbi:MAG: mercuric reductase [Chloroflexi bacterium]|nr:mercuric reductase [Chloroflexota bacterium]OJW00721.1 MAG: mercuric reductase [Chloroflexi bacterium 54-19]
MPEQYDAVLIGSGQAAGPLATALTGAGWKVALVEQEHVGGTCINEGCTPTKTMVASGRVAYLARRAADYGVHTGPVTIDMAKIRQRKRDIVDSFRGGNERRIVAGNVDLIYGRGSFTGPDSVEVRTNSGETRELTAKKIFINAGCRPSKPQVPGLDEMAILNSTSIMELDVVPEHLLILGGGYIGLEFGQLFRRLGSRVTIIQRGKQLLPKEDPDVAEEITGILKEDGLEILLETVAVSARSTGEGIALTVKGPSGEQELVGSHLLEAAGRVPNTDTLNLEAAGIATDSHGFIKVNDRLETNVPGVYALGDIKGGPAFTHISYDDFRIVRENLLQEGKQVSIEGRILPYTVFTDPQLGRVGLSENEARAQGYNIQVYKMPMSWVARALELDESRGLMKAVVDADTGQILGGALLGIEGGEMMAVLQMAMMGKLAYTVLKEAIFAHPTLAEAFNNLFSQTPS